MNLTPTFPTSLLLIALVASSPLVAASSAYTDENSFRGDVLLPGEVFFEAWTYRSPLAAGDTITVSVTWEGDADLDLGLSPYPGEWKYSTPGGLRACADGQGGTIGSAQPETFTYTVEEADTYSVNVILRSTADGLPVGEIPFTVTISVNDQAPTSVSEPANTLWLGPPCRYL